MKLSEKLVNTLYKGPQSVISVTGGGGKTSSLKFLASKFKEMGLSVLITTTTKFQGPKQYNWGLDYSFSEEADILSHEIKKGEIVYFAKRSVVDMKKYTSPRLEILSLLTKRFDVTIIEADGAKMLPLKLHTQRDPVIIDQTTATLAIMGASALNDRADNNCFGFSGDDIASIEFYQKLIDHEEGVLKGAKGVSIILINQCDLISDVSIFKSLNAPCEIVLGSINEDKVYV